VAKELDQLQYGDFQTPIDLARGVCRWLMSRIDPPATVLEPTCGQGSFLRAANEIFRSASHIIGVDRNASYVEKARRHLANSQPSSVVIRQGDFFEFDWDQLQLFDHGPLLVLGNPPWVNNSSLAKCSSRNVPTKSNLNRLRGIDAVTGASNFDISETILLTVFRWFQHQQGTVAMLCKTKVARKVLQYAWSNGIDIAQADLVPIDARQEFSASVDAALLVVRFHPGDSRQYCRVHESLNTSGDREFGMEDGRLVTDRSLYRRHRHRFAETAVKWRSGVKHDCARVMQLRRDGDRFTNGMGQVVTLERRFLFPMLKCSDLAKRSPRPRFWMLVPQRYVGQETDRLARLAPRTWDYLHQHRDQLRKRGSVVYRDKPDFSVFGVGEYSFSRWKVAVSGLGKTPRFHAIGPHHRKPMIMDDTCYFHPCDSESAARRLSSALNSTVAQEFFQSLIFTDEKRPVTAKLLGQLDLERLLRE